MTDRKEPMTTTDEPTNGSAEFLTALRRDLREAASQGLGDKEARYLVDLYYSMQDYRKATANQARAASEDEEPFYTTALVLAHVDGVERAIKSALDKWTDQTEIGRWAKSQTGIGPVLAAGLIAHIDPHKAETAGAVFRFAGMDPTMKWNKGEKRPYNASLKQVVWKIGESFSRQRGKDSFYAEKLRERKEYETAKNEAGEYASRAVEIMERKGYRKETGAWKHLEAGQLPPSMIESRVRRWTAKLFLAHFWEKWRELEGLSVPLPYPIAHQDHVHKIDPPEGE